MHSKKIIKTVVLCVAVAVTSVALHAQTRITGTVVDQNDEPVVGATVMEGGTMNGTQTDLDGKWSLQVADPQTAVIQFTCLGYENVEVNVRNRSVVNTVMRENAELLEDLVVVGFGTQKKVNLTGSVSTISASELGGSDRPIFNNSAALAGLVPGLQVFQTTGQPGKESTTLRLRGVGTFTSGATSPYVLVDGIEANMNTVNPDDIESISVLKDAASTSIYGTRAANGVIIITTKQGRESKPRISYSYSGIFQRPYWTTEYISDYATYMELVNETHENQGEGNQFSQTNIELWKAAKQNPNGLNEYGVPNYMAYPNTDWFDEVYHTGFSQEHKLSISGGSKNIRYLISGMYYDNRGIIVENDSYDSSSQKASVRVNLEADVAKWFTIGTKIFASIQNTGIAATSWIFNIVTSPGGYPGEPGKWGYLANSEDNNDYQNMFYGMSANGGYTRDYWLNGTLYAKIRPYKGLSIEGSFNYSPWMESFHRYTRYNAYWDYQKNELRSENQLADATVTDETDRDYDVTTDLLARYEVTIKKDHALGVLVGYQAKAYKSWDFYVQMKGATDWSLTDASTYSELYESGYTAPRGWALRGYFARVNYAFKDRYLFEANVRVDGSSKFGSDTRYGTFPSFSAGWKIHEEPWMQSASKWLSELKLRASWGQTGNDTGIGNYDWQSTYSTANVTMDGTTNKGLYIASASNLDLHWETTSTTDIGLDLGFFNQRLTAGIDYYYRATKDILYTPSSYLTMGYLTNVPANRGNMWNQGVEIALNWRDHAGDFYYYAGVNFSYNKNKVTKFKGELVRSWDEDGNFYTNYSDVAEGWGSGVLLEGHPIGDYFYRKLYTGTGEGYSGGTVDVNAGPVDGMIRTEADMAWLRAMCDAGYTFMGRNTVAKNQLWYGDFIYADLNKDGQYGDSNDMYFPGHTATPSYNLGVTFGFAWKGLDFSMVWSGAFDYWLEWNYIYYNTSNAFQGTFISKRVADDHYFYDPDNPADPRTNLTGLYNRLQNSDYNDQSSNFYDYRGDYMKLKNVTVGYTLPQKWTRKFFCEELRFYFSGENLFTITSYPGWDPEQGTSHDYPLLRQFTIGAQITF